MFDTATPVRPPRWCGWHCPPGSSWRIVATAATEDDAWRLLLDRPPEQGDKAVLLARRHPNRKAVS
jgi:hypothetical protein